MKTRSIKLSELLTEVSEKTQIHVGQQPTRMVISFFFLFLTGFGQPVVGQNIEDLKNVEVENLTDEQLLKFQSEIESRDLTQEELLTLARLNGISETKIQQLQLRLAAVGSAGGRTVIGDRGRESNAPVPVYGPKPKMGNQSVFGLSFFRNANLTFEPSANIPTPRNYKLGAGDELFIDIWGDAQKSYQLTLSPEGIVLIPDVGPIFLNGKTVEDAEKIIIRRIKSIFSSLGERSNALVTLGQTRSIKVHMVGEVEFPGTYTVSSFSTPFNALYQAKGPNKNGSFRNIKIRRDGKIIQTLDIYDYLLAKPTPALTLEDQDVLIVPPYENRVQISGSVKRPAVYEVDQDESLNELLKMAGGFSGRAFKNRLRIIRNLDSYRSVLTIERGAFEATPLMDGDHVIVTGIDTGIRNKLYIGGPVYQPGTYQVQEQMSLKDLINQAAGLKPGAHRQQALLYRKDENFEDYVISVDLLNQADLDLRLMVEDSLVIKRKEEIKFRETVKILGDVARPGTLLFVDSLTISHAVYLSGGFLKKTDTTFAEVSLPLAKDVQGGSEISVEKVIYDQFDSYELQPGSTILFRRDPAYLDEKLVLIEGEVVFPGYYAINNDTDQYVSDLISRAGGLKPTANTQGVSLIRIPEYLDRVNKAGDQLRVETLQEISNETESGTLGTKGKELVGLNFEEILRNPKGKYDLTLRDKDIVSVPAHVQTVRVNGEVLRPGSHRYDEELTFRDYINRAGGYSDNARKKKAFVVYANGNTIASKSFMGIKKYPKLEAGAEIFIPIRPEKRKLTVQEVLGITTSVVAIVLLIDRF